MAAVMQDLFITANSVLGCNSLEHWRHSTLGAGGEMHSILRSALQADSSSSHERRVPHTHQEAFVSSTNQNA